MWTIAVDDPVMYLSVCLSCIDPIAAAVLSGCLDGVSGG